MRPFRIAAAGIGIVAAAVAAPAAAPAGAPSLTMTCHMLLGGFPQADASVFTLVGRDLFARHAPSNLRISTEGAPMFIGRTVDKGVPTLSYASHVRRGPIVTRRVYWQEGTKPRRLAFTERYDFAAQTITSTGERGDSCHHDGR